MTAFSKGPTRTRRDKPAARPKSTFVQHPKGKFKDEGGEFEGRAPRKRFDDDRPPRKRFDDDHPPRRRFDDDRPPRRRVDNEAPSRGRYGDDRPPRGRGGFGEKRFSDRPPRREFSNRAPRGGGNSDVLEALGKIEAAIKELTKRLTLIENQLEEVFGGEEE